MIRIGSSITSSEPRKESSETLVWYFPASDAWTFSKIVSAARAGYFVMIFSTSSSPSTLILSFSVIWSCCSRSLICTSSTFLSSSCFTATEVSTSEYPRVESVRTLNA